MLLDTVEHETAPDPQWAVLWLHGLGADGHDFAPIVPELVRAGWPPLRFVFPHAPLRAVTINGGMRMRAWYDIRDLDLAHRADLAGVDASLAQVQALIEREAARGIPPQRLLLAGFSQGGAVTLAAGLARQVPLAGLVALSTYLPMPAQTARERLQPQAAAQPLFMAHGTFDPVVPLAAGEAAAELLRGFGFAAALRRYPMQHAVCAEEIADLGDWMTARLGAG
ncbi:MAG: alpha/beta hydrolase [Thermomonas sp.]